MKRALLAAVILTVALGACSNLDFSSENNQGVMGMKAMETMAPIASNYKTQVLALQRASLFDPYSVRDAYISYPLAMTDGNKKPFWLVCVKENAKNRFGAYTGEQAGGYSFDSNGITNTITYGSLCKANAMVYEPFPELGQS